MQYFFNIGSLYKDWDIEMVITVSEHELTFTERLVRPDYRKEIQGRRLSILDIPLFENVVGEFKERLDDFLTERHEKGKLTIDSLKRLCERHRIKYEESGQRLVTAYRKHIKELRASVNEREIKGRSLCKRAELWRKGNRPGTPQDYDEATRLFNEAIELDYLPAYGHLAIMLVQRGFIHSAIEMAENGERRGDGLSMIVLGDILSDVVQSQIPTDYKRAAKLYISACENGYCHKATPRLRNLISIGEYTPNGNLFMRLVMYEAKRTRQLREHPEDEYYLDPEYREAMLLKMDGGDEAKINEILEHAVEVNGKEWLSGFLATSYMRMHRWGKAAMMSIRGIEGINTRYSCAARLAEMGADFTGASDELGTPDYESAVAWSIKDIETGGYFGFVMLNHLIAEGHLNKASLPAEIATRLDDFNARAEPERRDINNYNIDCSFNKNAK